MRRWFLWVLGLAVLLAIVLIPGIELESESSGPADTARITSYRADFRVDRDGRLDATETLQVNLPFGKHGIFRFFDRKDPNDARVRLTPQNLRVTRDGAPEPFEVLSEGDGRYRNVKIGSADRTLEGEHTYVIRYTVDGVLGADGDRAEFYWNLVPGGWQMAIDRSRLAVRLPAAPTGPVDCAVGAGEQSGCRAAVDGSRLQVRTGALAPNTPVTVRTTLDMPAPERDRKAWPLRLDPVLGPNVVLLGAILVLAGLAGFAGWRNARQTREQKPAFPLMYAPPDGIGPAQAKYLLTERVGREAFVASVMQSAEKGATALSRDEGWTIRDAGQPEAWNRLDRVSAEAMQTLGVRGGSFTADKSVSAGKQLQSALSQFEKSTREWARFNGLMVPAGLGSAGGVVWLVCVAAAGVLALVNPVNLSALALVPGLYAVFGVETILPGASTRRTPAGRELWSRVGGFRRILATPSSEERFDFSGRKELYTAFIPYAVAFGVADQWAEKYRTETAEEPPTPSYFASAAGYGTGSLASSMVDDFSSTVDSAISAYQATQRSSSSGGGGFSGGGGGGGGGGGSW